MARGRPKGSTQSEEAKAKMRAYWSSYYSNPANRTKTSEACTVAWKRDHTTRAAILSAALKGKKRPAEMIARMAETQRRVRAEPECKKRQIQAAKDFWASPQRSARIRDAHAKRRVVFDSEMDATMMSMASQNPPPTWQSIADAIGVNISTLRKRRDELGVEKNRATPQQQTSKTRGSARGRRSLDAIYRSLGLMESRSRKSAPTKPNGKYAWL